jgi:hypothetical protein
MNAPAPDESPNAHDVFISYSRKDLPFAQALQRALGNYAPPRVSACRGAACASSAIKAT